MCVSAVVASGGQASRWYFTCSASRPMPIRPVLVLVVPLLCAACGSDSPTSPATPPSTTASVAPATIDESYSSTLPIAGSRFYSFPVVQNGTVNVTLTSLAGPDVTEEMTVDLGLGRPSGFGCTPTSTVTVSTLTAAPQITGTFAPGVYCVRIADTAGILTATATFSISIEHS